MSFEISRRSMLFGGAAAVGLGAFGLTACGAGGSNIRFAWYGGSERQQAYMQLLQSFEEETGIAVDPEYADYEPYQDRMVTQFAAGDGPDLFFMAGFNVLEWHTNGQLHEVDEFVDSGVLDLSGMDPQLVDDWRIDGRLTAVPYAYWNAVIRSNRDFADEVGIEIPDDESWTWGDFAEICQEFSDATEDGRYGTNYGAYADLPFNAFLRQIGQELFTVDGEVGFDADGVGEWLDFWERLEASGASMSVQEQEGVNPGPDTVQPRALFFPGNANHLANDQPGVEWELDVHMVPTVDDPSPGHRYLHVVRFGVYEQSSDPEASAQLMNFLLNSEEVPPLVGQNQGIPTSQRLQDVARDTADETGQKVIEVIEREAAHEMRPRAEVPPGAGNWRGMMAQAIESVALDGASISQASQTFVDELTEAVERAS